MTLVLQPLAFVDAAILVDKYAEAFTLALWIELASIDAVFVLLDAEIAIFAHLFVVKLIADHLILLNCVTFILKLALMLA